MTVWQSVESMRYKFVARKYDPTRGGARLSKGHLYSPVFNEDYHNLFFIDLPLCKVLEGVVDVEPACENGAGAEAAGASGNGASGVASQTGAATPDNRGEKRARVDVS